MRKFIHPIAGQRPRFIRMQGKGIIKEDFTAYAVIFNIPSRSRLEDYKTTLIIGNSVITDSNLLAIRSGNIYFTPEYGIREGTEYKISPDDIEVILIGHAGYKKTPLLKIEGVVADGGKLTTATYKVENNKIFRLFDIFNKGVVWDDVSTSTISRNINFRITADDKVITESIPFNSRIFTRTEYFLFEPFDIARQLEFYAGSELERFHYPFVLIGQVIDKHILEKEVSTI